MKTIYYILGLLLLTACYDDKGNYNYSGINEVQVKLDEVYGVRLQDTTLVIRLQLNQSMKEKRDNLKFTWYHSDVSEKFYAYGDLEPVSHADTVAFRIDPNDKALKFVQYFRCNVYDEVTGIEYPVKTMVKIAKPYHGAWMVLHSKNGQTQLGAVEYVGTEMPVCEDAYFRETGKQLKGNPLCLGVHNAVAVKYYGGKTVYNAFAVITDVPDEAGIYCQWNKFQKMDSISRMVAPSYRSEFGYSGIKLIEGGSYGGLCLTDGSLYHISSGLKLYKAHIDPAVTGPIDLSHGTKVGFVSLYYDKAGKRFLNYCNYARNDEYDPNIFNESTDNDPLYKLALIPERENNVKGADPNHLEADREVLYVGAGYWYGPNLPGNSNRMYVYALAKSPKGCYVYEFDSYGLTEAQDAAFTGYYPIETPKGLNENSCFASGLSYNGILFYASGDKVYRLDFMQKGGAATTIYTHPGGKAKTMKFAKKGRVDKKVDYSEYGFDVNRSLGVVFEMGDGTCELVVLNLANTGKIAPDGEVWPSIQVHKGFGDIKDIEFL